jgi:hypothetical protein
MDPVFHRAQLPPLQFVAMKNNQKKNPHKKKEKA